MYTTKTCLSNYLVPAALYQAGYNEIRCFFIVQSEAKNTFAPCLPFMEKHSITHNKTVFVLPIIACASVTNI